MGIRDIRQLLGLEIPDGRWYLVPNENIHRVKSGVFDSTRDKSHPVVIVRDLKQPRVIVRARSASSRDGIDHEIHTHNRDESDSDVAPLCVTTKPGRIVEFNLEVDRDALTFDNERCDEPNNSRVRHLIREWGRDLW